MTKVKPATLDDLTFVDSLRKREGNALGFIPIQRYEMEVNGERKGSLYLSWDNGDPTGYIYATHSGRGTTHIIQVAVQEDARRMERATALLDSVRADAAARHSWLLSLRCADDLEANEFWAALGFSLEARGVSPKSVYALGKSKEAKNERGRRLNIWQRVEAGLWRAGQ